MPFQKQSKKGQMPYFRQLWSFEMAKSEQNRHRKKVLAKNLNSLMGGEIGFSVDFDSWSRKVGVDARRLRRWCTEGAARPDSRSIDDLQEIAKHFGLGDAEQLWNEAISLEHGRARPGDFPFRYAAKVRSVLEGFSQQETEALCNLIDEAYLLLEKRKLRKEIGKFRGWNFKDRASVEEWLYTAGKWRGRLERVDEQLNRIETHLHEMRQKLPRTS